MMSPNNEEKKKGVIEFLKKNPKSTCKILKNSGYTHLERLFKKGLGEAFKEAGLNPPRTFERKTREQRRRIIINYIKKHPIAGGQDIQKDTKINIKNAFRNTKEAFKAAEITYPRRRFLALKKRTAEERKKAVINLIKENPYITLKEVMQKLRISPYKLFDNFDEAYKLAAIENVGSTKKRKIKKRKLVMEFIMQNQTATQREINRNCKTKVQELFKQGIFGAYKESGIEFPFKRLKIHGAAIKEVKQRAKDFEGEIARKLSCYGNINRLIKTKRGVADIILERGDKKIIIEVKDYLNKEICQHEIKQLYKYLQDCECGLGLIICHTKPRKDRFIINRNKILILESNELNKIPEILDKE